MDADASHWQLVDERGAPVIAASGTLNAMQVHRLALLTRRHGTGAVNVPVPTLGGRQFWADEFWSCGWRIQANHWTGHCRLIDARGVRRAWGTFAACRVAFERERLKRGLHRGGDHLVVVLHGLAGIYEFRPLRRALADQGWEVAALRYPSTRRTIADHAAQLGRVLDRLDGYRSVSFVTHSLGALVVRCALARSAGWRQRLLVDRAVFAFAPNRGAMLADKLNRWWMYRWLLGPAGQELTTANASRIPRPDIRFATIAGGRGDGRGRNPFLIGDNDRTVTVDETRLDGAEDHAVFDVEHTFGLNRPEVVAAVVAYLTTGRLSHGQHRSGDTRSAGGLGPA